MSQTDWVQECCSCELTFEGAEMIPLGEGDWICHDCIAKGGDES